MKPMDAGDTLVTVLFPLKYYHSEYLEKALASIQSQTCPHWRLLILVEGGDRRKFSDLLSSHLDDERVSLVVNSGRKFPGALNSGLRAACTEFTGILLADDTWSEDAVEVLSRSIREHPEVDFFHSSRRVIDEQDEALSSVYRSVEKFELEDFKRASPVRHLMCWRRDMALAAGGIDESLNSVGPDDYDFPWTMAEHGAVFMAIEECLYNYRDHRDCYRLTTHQPLDQHKREIARIMRKHGATTAEIEKKISRGERTFLRQCLFRSRLHALWRRLIGYNPRDGWRQTFR